MFNRLLATILIFISYSSLSQTISIDGGEIRTPIPGMKNTAGYMTIINNGNKPITLVSASSIISDKVEFHTHEMLDGVMKMRKLDQLMLKPNEKKVLQPGGLHLMFLGINQRNFANTTVKLVDKDNNEYLAVLEAKSVKAHHKHHH